MKQTIIYILVLLGAGMAPVLKAASIAAVDSASAIETRLATVIGETLNIETQLEPLDEDKLNLRVRTLISADKERGNPQIATYIDTAILVKKQGQVVSQTIIVASVADIELVTTDRLKLLEWVNAWNGSLGPVRVQITEGELIASADLMLTANVPATEAQVVNLYLTVTRMWPRIIDSLEKQALLGT